MGSFDRALPRALPRRGRVARTLALTSLERLPLPNPSCTVLTSALSRTRNEKVVRARGCSCRRTSRTHRAMNTFAESLSGHPQDRVPAEQRSIKQRPDRHNDDPRHDMHCTPLLATRMDGANATGMRGCADAPLSGAYLRYGFSTGMRWHSTSRSESCAAAATTKSKAAANTIQRR